MEWNGEKYDAWYDTSLGSYVLEQELALVKPYVRGRVLDAGCGTGRFMKALRDEGLDVVGIEPDPSMAAVAKKRMGTHGVEIMRLDEAPQLIDDTFDTVLMNTVLQFVDDPMSALEQARRMLQKGGRLVVGELHPDAPWNRWRREHNDFFRELPFIHPMDLGTMAGKVGLSFVGYGEGVFLPPMDWLRDRLMPLFSMLSQPFAMTVLSPLEKTAIWKEMLRLPPVAEIGASLAGVDDRMSLEEMPRNLLKLLEKLTPGPGAYYVGVFEVA